MKKKLLFCTVFALCVSQSWGMGLDVRAGQIMRNISGKRVALEGIAGHLAQLQATEVDLQRAFDDPRLQKLAAKKAELEGLQGVQSALGVEEDPEVTRQLQNAEVRISELTDQLKPLGLEGKRGQLDDVQRRIAELGEDRAEVEGDIRSLELDLAEIPEDDRLQAEFIAAQRARQVEGNISFENWKARRAKQQERLSRVVPEVEGLPKSFEEVMQSPAAAPKSQSAIGKKTGGAIVTALAIAITTYVGRRIYQKKKERLMRKYKLASLTPLQNNVWRAVALAHIRMPWYLQYLIKNNTGTLTDFIGSNPQAAAELYYGRVPNEAEVKAFQGRFFGNVQ